MLHAHPPATAGPAPARSYAVRRLSLPTAPHALRDGWEGLTARLGEPAFYHRWEWHAAHARHLADRPWTFYGAYDAGELVAVLPLGPASGADAPLGRRALVVPENPQINLADVVLAPGAEHALEALLGEACAPDGRPWDLLSLHRVPERAGLLRAAPLLPHLWSLSDGGGSTFFDCRRPASLERLSSKLWRNLDRLHRRARREGGSVRVERFGGPAASEEGYGHFLRVEASGWKGRAGSAVAHLPPARSFFAEVLRSFARTDDARVDVLRIGGCPAAAHLLLRAGAVWYVLKTGYVPSFASHGPGQLLLARLLEEAAEDESVREVNLVTAPAWAERWHSGREPVHTVRIYGRTPGGFLLSLGRRAKEVAKQVRDGRSLSEAAL